MEAIHDGATRAAIVEVMRAVRAVGKDDKNKQQNFMFRGIDAVLNAVGPALRDKGVTVMPEVEKVEHDVRTTQGDRGERTINHYRVWMLYHFQVPHGEVMTASSAGEAMDYGDKGLTKAQSVAYRTCLIQMLALPTGERDPDHDSYEIEQPPPSVNELRKIILNELTRRRPPWTLAEIEADFANKVGGSIRDASVDQLQQYVELIRHERAA